MQRAHNWVTNLDKMFKDLGYYKSRADLQIQSQVINDEFMLTFTWTDDVLGVSSTLSRKISAKDQLTASYNIKDIGNVKLILEICIEQDEETGDIQLTQQVYCERMLKKFGMESCTPSTTPLPAGINLSVDNILSCFTHNLGKQHWIALKHILSYIKGITNFEPNRICGHRFCRMQGDKEINRGKHFYSSREASIIGE